MRREGRRPEVYILATQNDVHAIRVCEELRELGADSEIIDSRSDGPISAEFLDGGQVHLLVGSHRVTSESVLWRRRHWPRRIDQGITDDRLRSFATAEWSHGLQGGLLATGCRFVNDRGAEFLAQHKPLQISSAQAVGLSAPNTLVTNDRAALRDFYVRATQGGERVIYKPLTPLDYHLGETRQLTEAMIDDPSLVLAPVIFQNCIERGRDLRVFVAGSRMSAAEVVTTHSALIDWRLDQRVEYRKTALSDDLASAIGRLMRRLNLITGSIDLREDSNGRTFFLEVNPSGQFLMLEEAIGENLSAMLASALVTATRDEGSGPRREDIGGDPLAAGAIGHIPSR